MPPPASLGGPAIHTPADVAQYTRAAPPDHSARLDDLGAAWEVQNIDPLAGLQFDQFQTIIQAVMAGMGVALVPRCLVEGQIAKGLVREPLPDHGLVSDLGYWLCYPESRADVAPLVAFRNWLLQQARPYKEPTSNNLATQQKRSRQRSISNE